MLESEDLAGELRDYGERLAGEEGSLEEVEQRLAATERLVRKHGGSIADVLAYAERARARREELDGAQGALAQTGERLARARAELERHVAELRRARELAAPRLAEGRARAARGAGDGRRRVRGGHSPSERPGPPAGTRSSC